MIKKHYVSPVKMLENPNVEKCVICGMINDYTMMFFGKIHFIIYDKYGICDDCERLLNEHYCHKQEIYITKNTGKTAINIICSNYDIGQDIDPSNLRTYCSKCILSNYHKMRKIIKFMDLV